MLSSQGIGRPVVEVSEPTSSIHWKPKKGETYWWYSPNKIPHFYNWKDDNTDDDLYTTGNTYRTEEECREAIELQEAITTLRRSSAFEPNWNDHDQEKWVVFYFHKDDSLQTRRVLTMQYVSLGVSPIYQTYEEAEASIKEYEKEWLIYFGVKQ